MLSRGKDFFARIRKSAHLLCHALTAYRLEDGPVCLRAENLGNPNSIRERFVRIFKMFIRDGDGAKSFLIFSSREVVNDLYDATSARGVVKKVNCHISLCGSTLP
jgi:hypothetical protein